MVVLRATPRESVPAAKQRNEPDTPVLHRPQKQTHKKPILPTNPRLEPPLPPFFYVRCFVVRQISSLTSKPKVHHPAIDSLVLSLQCGKATAVFVSSRHRDFVAQVEKCGSRSLDSFFLLLWPSVRLLLSIDEHYSYVRVFFQKSRLM